MPCFEHLVDDGRRRLAALARIAVASAVVLAAAPVAHADLTSRPRPVAHAGANPLARALALQPRPVDMTSDVLGSEPELPGTDWPMPLWLSQAWPLGPAIRPAPAAMLTLWLAGSVHQVLGWLAPSMPSASDSALDAVLDRITIEPVSGAETSSYGYREDPFTGRRKMHKGVDYRAPRGTPVLAAGPGVVRVARRKRGYGRVVMIDHGQGVQTRYAHLQRIDVDAGERVAPGTRIGTVGSTGRATGPHLHFELRIDGEAHDPLLLLGPLAPGHLANDRYY